MSSKIEQIQENPFKLWLVLSVPIIILFIFNQLYTIFDTFILAKLGNDVIIALGFISQIYYFIISTSKGIGRAVASMVARLIGAQKYKSINNIVLHGLLTLIIVSVLSQIVFALFSYNVLGLFVPQEQIQLVHIYLECIFAGLQFIFLSEFLVEIVNAEGSTRLSTAIMACGIFLNIVMDYIFVFSCNMHIFGASLGTVMSYVVTTSVFLYFVLIKKDNIVKFDFKDFKFDLTIIREIIVSSFPLIIDSLLISLSGILAVMALNQFAQPITIVAYYLVIRIQTLLFTPLYGLAKSGNIIIGHLFGAKRFHDVINHVNKSIITSLMLNCVIIIFLIILINPIIGFFTTDSNVIIEAKNIFYIVIFELIALVVILICNHGLIAIGRTQNSLYSLIIKFTSVIIWIYILCNLFGFGEEGVFISLIMGNITQCFYSYFILRYSILKASRET